MTQVLVIDDEEVLARSICTYLDKKGYSADFATTSHAGISAFREMRPSLTLLDYRLGSDDGVSTLRRLREIDENAAVVMMTGHGDVGVAVDAMKAGARDFLTKPAPLSMIYSLASELVPASLKEQKSGATSFPLLIGRSSAVQELRQSLERILGAVRTVREAPPSVLISGETGTGKELIARTLHIEGPRAAGPFISINCAALPDHLVEAELFGYEKGAFTDAATAKPGLFEAAAGGVLFLDEVGELSLTVQAKLLRVLEERKVRRLASLVDREVDVWVISASNRALADMVSQGRFRSDLMFRLEVLSVEAPPLRERDGDVLVLAKHFLAEMAQRYGRSVPELASDARAMLVGHCWSGNVRELRNSIERALIACQGDVLTAEHLELRRQGGRLAAQAGAEARTGGLQEIEIAAIRRALDSANGNITRAASLLEISRDTLRYRIEKYGLRH